ncbi:MAG: hypothetical protein M3082_03560 [Candidatus Dormibacteraeota bacterium]|nr:hypothetical protein [Candidatus Dormibacteraeota bacterium]
MATQTQPTHRRGSATHANTTTTSSRRRLQPSGSGDLHALDRVVKQLRREIAQLRQKAARDAATVGESALRPLRRQLERAVSSLATAPSARQRRAPAPPTPPRPRRKITDPVVLERRRQALAKARQVRAGKLAAAR